MSMKTKRAYIKPEIVKHSIDMEISLVMTSDGTPPVDPFATSTSSEQSTGDISTLNDSNFDQNPFEEIQ